MIKIDTIEALYGLKRRYVNSLLVQKTEKTITLLHSGEIEAWSRGIERITTACKNGGFSMPEFRYDGTSFVESYLGKYVGFNANINDITFYTKAALHKSPQW